MSYPISQSSQTTYLVENRVNNWTRRPLSQPVHPQVVSGISKDVGVIHMRIRGPHHFGWRIGSIDLLHFRNASFIRIVVQNLDTIRQNPFSLELHSNSLLGNWIAVTAGNCFAHRSCTSRCRRYSKERRSLRLFEYRVTVT